MTWACQAMAAARQRQQIRLAPEVNRALYVRNLPFKITSEEMYDIFGKFGPIRQIRAGTKSDTKGTVRHECMPLGVYACACVCVCACVSVCVRVCVCACV